MTTEPEALTAPRIALSLIDPDPNNPRKTFDKDELAELATSIKVHGVVQPIKLRPHPTKNHGSFMIVVGERRYRASKLAGLDDIPAIVENLDDKRALEQQIVENTQRADVHPLEEAESFEILIRDHDYSVAMLAEKTGRSESHIHSRRRLLKLTPAVKKALRTGKLTPMIAGLAASIHVPKLQEEFVEDVLGTWPDKEQYERAEAVEEIGIRHEDLNPEAKQFGKVDRLPLSFRAAQALLHRKYSTRLALAKFPIADAVLVPEAGACTTCPKRSGNQPELFPDLSKPEDVCTDATCFQQKTDAVWKAAKLEAKGRGLEVIEGDDAKDIFGYDGTTTRKSNYVDPNEELPYELQKSPGAKSKWNKLLGNKVVEIPRVLAMDPNGAPRELIDKRKAVEVLRELKKIDAPVSTKSAGATSERSHYDKERKKEEAKRELGEAALQRVLAQVAEKAAADLSDQKELALLRWVVRGVVRDYAQSGGDGGEAVLERRGLENYDVLEQQVIKAKGPGDVRAILVELVFALNSDGKVNGFVKEHREFFEAGLQLLGIDWDKAIAAAKEAAKAEEASEAAKKKGKATDDGKRCGLVNGKKGDGCIHELGHEGLHSNGKQTWSDPKVKKKGGAK